MTGMTPAVRGLRQRRAHLLVIDDDNLQRMIVRKVAEQVGFVLSEASSYDAALATLTQQTFDCLLLDLSLGQRSGVELLRLLKQARSRTPIIIMSGSHESITNMAIGTGRLAKLDMREPMPKPVSVDVMEQRLSQMYREAMASGAPAVSRVAGLAPVTSTA